jgi:hypothetical protein
MNTKPLNRKAYGSIPHLPNSRLGPADHCISEGQANICTVQTRDHFDNVIVQEKLDGSCTAVALVKGELVALVRPGFTAQSSPFPMHQMFARWVNDREDQFQSVLEPGERVVGEWLAQVHGTVYTEMVSPWAVFDVFDAGNSRLLYSDMLTKLNDLFFTPTLLHQGYAMPVHVAMPRIKPLTLWKSDDPEGVVYRVERKGRVDFLAKWVRPDKIDGEFLDQDMWNWRD